MSAPDAGTPGHDASQGPTRPGGPGGLPPAEPPGSVGIVGLGLIGGSLALDLADAGWTVQGTDRDARTRAAALEAGAIEGPIDPGRTDVVVLAVPVGAAPGWIDLLSRSLPDDRRVTVTDVASTKRSVDAASRTAGLDAFVGSHPVAGDHRSGWDAARRGLFQDAPVWICPGGDANEGDVARVESLWRTVGGEPHRTDPSSHDHLLARSSHLPQLVATALAAALHRAGVTPDQLGPGGRDTTRLAASDPDLWMDILIDNADEVAPALDGLLATLGEARAALGEPAPGSTAGHDIDAEALRALLAAGRAWRRDTG